MRLLTGTIALPPNAPSRPAALTLIEIRDVSVADAPSVVVAQKRLSSMVIVPNALVTFQIEVPEVADNQSLALRIHISMDGDAQPKPGDLLSVSRYAVPSRGKLEPVSVQVVVI
jgi:putative lipoprotein